MSYRFVVVVYYINNYSFNIMDNNNCMAFKIKNKLLQLKKKLLYNSKRRIIF